MCFELDHGVFHRGNPDPPHDARGLRETEPELLDLVRQFKGSRWQLFAKIQLPGALPYIFSGMKVGAILAVAAVVGEFLA